MKSLSHRLAFQMIVIAAGAWLAPVALAGPTTPAETPAGAAAPAPENPAGAPVAGGLTAADVVRRALAVSPDLRARSHEAVAAEHGQRQARAAFLPRVSGSARYTRLSPLESPSLGALVATADGSTGLLTPQTPLVAVPLSFPMVFDQYAAQATLSVPLSDYLHRLPRLVEAARGNARAARWLETAGRARVVRDARIAYYAWARARLESDVVVRAVAQAHAHQKDVEAAHASGSSSKADVLRVAAQVAGAEALLVRARAAVANTERRLRVLMHEQGETPYEIGEDLRASSAEPGESLPALLTEALAARPEAKALAETAGAMKAQANAVRAAAFPRLDAVANASYARPNGRIFPQKDEFRGTWDVSVQLSWAPTDHWGAEAGRDALSSRARQIDEERAAVIDGITMEVSQGWEAIHEADAASAAALRRLGAAAESYRVRRSLYQNGRSTSVELTDAESEHLRAEMEAIAARLDRRIAEARLHHALGRPVP